MVGASLCLALSGVVLPRAVGAMSASGAAGVPTLLYVDPCDEQMHVLPSIERRGAEVMLLHSAAAAAKLMGQPECDEDAADRIRANMAPEAGEELVWAAETLPDGIEVVGVLCGSDGGLADAERLAEALVPARSNGISSARRDKFEMLETIRRAGLAAPMQAAPASWEASKRFLATQSYPVVLKPRRGQASVLVGLARDEKDAQRMDAILRDPKCATSIDTSELRPGDENVLIQEFLTGDEWVVDTVSADGEHKVVALWKYDKRQVNDAPFVYFGIDARGSEGAVEEAVLSYSQRVLDALGWKWGPCHIELKMVPTSTVSDEQADGAAPVLIEINAGRWNGEDFQLLAELCNGYDAFEATLDAYLDPDAWDELPPTPPEQLRACGKNVKLVSRQSGPLLTSPHETHADELSSMPSLLNFVPLYNEPGDQVIPTVDLNTCAGYAHLVHADPEVVEMDYRALQELVLFEVDEDQ